MLLVMVLGAAMLSGDRSRPPWAESSWLGTPASSSAEIAAKSYASGLRNRLRVADHALRSVANDIAARGLEASVEGMATRQYFHALAYVVSGQRVIDLHGKLGKYPALSKLLLEDLANGASVIVTAEVSAETNRILLVRRIGHDSTDPDLLIAELAPRHLWEGVGSAQARGGICVRESTGSLLHCTKGTYAPLHRQFSLAHFNSEAGLGALSTSDAAWALGYMRFDLPTSDFSGTWTVTALEPAGAGQPGQGGWQVLAYLLAACAGMVGLVLWITRHRTRGTVGEIPLPPSAGQTPAADPSLTSRLAFGPNIGQQRQAIKAMAEIDRGILAQASVQHLIELAATHLPTFVDCDNVSIAALDGAISTRINMSWRRAGTGESVALHQCVVDQSFEALLSTAPDGIWIKDPQNYRCLAKNIELGISRAFVIPLYADAKPVGVIVLGLIDRNRLAPEECSYARALADRLGVALTAAARAVQAYAKANFDPVTNLPNRQYLIEHLPQQIARTRREGQRLAVLFIDLDGFREVNLAAGHGGGDQILLTSAQRLRAGLREEDLVARFGSDEFVIVLPHVPRAIDATRVAEKSIAALTQPFVVNGDEYRLGACIGISVFPDDAPCVETLMRHADAAMFRAKETGRNQFLYFDGEANRQAEERAALERDLRAALNNGEVFLAYQPQIDLRTGRIESAEALIRWHHPRRGMISPAHFIPIAEQSRMIVEIGDFALRTACAQYVMWDTAGVAPARISVNVTSAEIRQADFLTRVETVLRETGMRPYCLELEITERMFVSDSNDTLDKLHALQARGVRIAIDDFGTGYSSLSYLKRLPVDVVKIDQSFVQDIVTDQDSASIIRAIIGMAHSLGRKVIAEGVETREARDYLVRCDCDQGQGYLWSRPLIAEDFIAFCRDFSSEAACEPSPMNASRRS